MSSQTVGITFRETMSGAFALGATDPAAGEKKGRQEGSELAMHAAIDIDDIDRFISDPNHLGGLSGTIDFTPFGEGIPAPTGVFNLFRPTEDPKLTLMVYELGFQHGGKSYYLAGHKNVKDDPGFDLWKDTTTLLTSLYEGTDKSGPVVGAGILTLGVKELIQLVSSMRAKNASSAAEAAEAIGKIGKFFLGELWDSYARHARP